MADALHTQSPRDESEAKSTTFSQLQPDEAPSTAVLPAGEVSAQNAVASSARLLQPPTFSFTPATPSPPASLSHDGMDDSLIEGLIGEVNSLSSTSLGKVSTLDSDPLEFPRVLGGDVPDLGSGNNADLAEKLPGVSESSFEKLSSLVDSTKLNFGESTGLAECLPLSNDIPIPKPVAPSMDSRNQPEVLSKGVEKPSDVAPTDSPEKVQTVNSEPHDRPSQNSLKQDSKVSEALENLPAAGKQDGADSLTKDGLSPGDNSKMSFPAKMGEIDASSPILHLRDDVEVSGSHSRDVKVSASHPRDDVEEFGSEKLFGTCHLDKEPSSTFKSLGHPPAKDLPSDLPSVVEKDPLCLRDALSVQALKSGGENSQSVCQDQNIVSEAQKACRNEADFNMEATNVIENSALFSEDSSPPLPESKADSEPMEVDQEAVDEKRNVSSKNPEVNGNILDTTAAESVKENFLSELTVSSNAKKTDSGVVKEGEGSKVSSVLLNDSEPLQPVTIGGSLQPLEEVQEASMLNDPSFTADLSLIDSSADEADSIGGLVINSVIGAADGVADFPPDDEMETDRQLTDISSSAPRMVQESDLDSGEDNGPSAKRRKLENGEKDTNEKLGDSKKVLLKVAPVKNGHGLWDSLKLKEVLLSKGTILLRIHASSDDLDNFDSEKCEIEVDFTCLMVSAVEEENYQLLGLSTQEPDSDVCDPLAIGTNSLEQTHSPPHYTRPFAPQTRGRSTALQPAMPRPPYRQLQSPPHVYNKNEVLGLPQPLEFEEPQMGATDWSGKEYYAGLLLQRKAIPLSHHHHYPASPAQLLPPRGRKRGRPPLAGRRGFAPIGGSARSSPSKARSQGKNLPDPIKFRPPTPPQHLLISSLLKMNKSPSGNNKADNKKLKNTGDSPKTEVLLNESKIGLFSIGKMRGDVGCKDEEDEIVTESQPHFANSDDSNDTDVSLKRFMVKLSCEFCDLVFRKRASLNAHVKHKHRCMQKCPICNANVKVKSKYGMRFHILKAHRNQPTFHCGKCGESFKLKHHLMNHERMRHELMDSDDEEERKQMEEKERELERKIREDIEAEERKVKENIERDRLDRLKELEEKKKDQIEKGKESAKLETKKSVDTGQIHKCAEESHELSESVVKKVPKEASRTEEKNDHEVRAKPIVSRVVANQNNKNPKPISRGKVMNVRPPGKVPVSRSKKSSASPSQRVTRSSSKTEVDSDNETSGSDSDDGEDDESSTSSSDVEVLEKSDHVCDICGKGFSHVFKLKHHLKSEHSKTKRSKDDAKEDVEEEEDDDEEDAVEDDDDEDDDDSEDDDEEEEELRKQKEKREKERREKEISLTCSTCNKVCRSAYQLKLHLPTHTLVSRKQGVRKSHPIAKLPGKSTEVEGSEEPQGKGNIPKHKNKESLRILRSSPHGLGKKNERSGSQQKRGRQNNPRSESMGLSSKEKQESLQKKGNEETSSDRKDKGERPSFILKVGHLFRCTKCNVTFNREKSMTYHLKKIHETLYPFKACEHCGRVFRSCGPYNRHLLQHKVYYCPEGNCKAKFRKMLRLKQHQKNAHPNKKHRCPKCVALFAKSAELDRHYEAKHPRQPSDEEDECSDDEDDSESMRGSNDMDYSDDRKETSEDRKESNDDRRKDSSEDRRKDSSGDKRKDSSGDRRKDSSGDRRKDSSGDRRKDSSEDRRKDSNEDRRKDSSEDKKRDGGDGRKKERSDERRRDSCDDKRKKEKVGPPKERKKEDSGFKFDEMIMLSKRKARCVPISYKEPEEEEDLNLLQKDSIVKQERDTRNSRERCSISSEVKLAFEKKHPEIKTESKNPITPDTPRRTRLKGSEGKKSLSESSKKANKLSRNRIEKKKKSVIKLRGGIDSTIKARLSKILSPRKNDKMSKIRTSPKISSKSGHTPLKSKKTKVTLSWTAALKAQIRAAESGSKSIVKKKKKPPSPEKPVTKAVTKAVTKTVSKTTQKTTPKSASTTKSKSRASAVSGVANLNMSHEFMHHHDTLPYQGYLVGDDSMFSLDDNSQMDMIGDYYGSHYPPSEEISDFVPDDDESGPAKIIGFDSF